MIFLQIYPIVQMSEFLYPNTCVCEQDMDRRTALDMQQHSRAITFGKILRIHGSADTTIPVEDAHSFHNTISNSELFVLEGADHNYKCV